MTPPERFKPREDWTPDEILEHQRTGHQPETSEYRDARREALEAAGLEHDDPAELGEEELSTDARFARLRNPNRSR